MNFVNRLPFASDPIITTIIDQERPKTMLVKASMFQIYLSD